MDPEDDRSKAAQLYDQIRGAIADGRLQPGNRLTPSRTVAAQLGVARATVTAAYTRLAAEGYIDGRSGRGSLVAVGPRAVVRSTPVASLRPTATAALLRPFDPDPASGATYDFRPGRLDPDLFPVAAWRRCFLRTLGKAPGLYGDPGGTEDLRAVLSNWSARSRGVHVRADQILITSGAGHAVDLVARVLAEPGDTVAVEEPGYPPVVALLRSQGLDVHGVPVDASGIIVDAIPHGVRFVYVTPSHQFPLGVVMSRRRRLELLQWAGAHGAAIVEDDYDSEFRYTARPLEPLQLLDRDGRVIYVGTFSKSLSPALRVGFLIAPPPLLPALMAVRQAVDWCPPLPTQGALTHFIADGYLDRHLRKARRVYTQRHQLMRAALDRRLPAAYRLVPATAGLHFTVLGPGDPDDPALEAALSQHGLLTASLRRTYASRPVQSGLVLGFACLPNQNLDPAVQALGAVLARHDNSSGRR